MPDYLGKDQRKLRDDDTKEEKPFQGKCALKSSASDIWDKMTSLFYCFEFLYFKKCSHGK